MLYGEKVKQARVEKQLTQAELAAMTGSTRQTINLIEAGRFNPSLKLCLDIAVALGKTLDELFWLSGSGILDAIDQVLIADIGSTTTKVVLLEKNNGIFHLAGDAESPTTVENPDEDVKIGLVRAFRKLEESTGKALVTESGKPRVPFFATSSAGGGLQVMAFGISSTDTGKAAEMTVLGAGGIILQTFTIDDGLTVIHKMRQIRSLHPDMILMAGGTDGGNIASIVRLAEVLSLSHPVSKFDHSKKIPLIYSGNKDAFSYVESMLKEQFEVVQTANIRPTLSALNIEPAKNAVHDAFMEHVMEQAPGYRDVKKWVKTDMIPTPAGVEKMLMVYGEHARKNIVMFDIGGATTDFFSNIYGEYSRTVAANTGMSYSITQVMADAGIRAIMDKMAASLSEDDVRDYICNKMLNPCFIPQSPTDSAIEQSVATVAIELAWKQHQAMCFKQHKLGFLEKRRSQADYDPFEEVFYVKDEEKLFQMSDIDTVVAAGGVVRHAHTHEVLLMIADGVRPHGVVQCMRDHFFKSPHLGLLSTVDSETALRVFENDTLEDIGWIVAPIGKIKTGKDILSVTAGDITYTVKGGEVLLLAQGGAVSIQALGSVAIKKNITSLSFEAATPVIIDCRGRGEYFNGRPLHEYNLPLKIRTADGPSTVVTAAELKVQSGSFRVTRELPYKGEVFVGVGERVTPETVVGENRCTPPRVYILDIRRIVGYDKKLTDEEIKTNLVIKPGDLVEIEQKIFHTHMPLFGEVWHKSPVRGEVVRIDKGLVMMREVLDYPTKPVVIDIVTPTREKPAHIKSILNFKEGDYVEKGMQLVKLSPELPVLNSPATGTVKEINTEKGTITIQYDNKPVPLYSFVKGTVAAVEPGMCVEIEGHGAVVYGVFGLGGENSGELMELKKGEEIDIRSKDMVILMNETITKEHLKRCVTHKVKGIIAPSLHASAWVSFYGKELGAGFTGNEEIPFTLVLTEGFGRLAMKETIYEFFKESCGKTISLSGRTQIRAGVLRPMVIIAD